MLKFNDIIIFLLCTIVFPSDSSNVTHCNNGTHPCLCEYFGSQYDPKNNIQIPELRVLCDFNKSRTSDLQLIKLDSNTTHLNITHHNITTINRLYFQNLTHLQKLSMKQNHISFIEHGAFEGLLNLVKLDLSFNDIDSLELKMFSGLPKLQRLNLTANPFSTIPEGTFDALPSLKWLNLPSDTLKCDCKLKWMVSWISRNRIKVPPSATCHSPRALRGKIIRKLKRKELHCNWSPEFYAFDLIPSLDQVLFEGDTFDLTCHISEPLKTPAILAESLGSPSSLNVSRDIKVEWRHGGILIAGYRNTTSLSTTLNGSTTEQYIFLSTDRLLPNSNVTSASLLPRTDETSNATSAKNIAAPTRVSNSGTPTVPLNTVVSTLTIDRLQDVRHTGTWTCTVHTLDKGNASRTVSLTVISPTTKYCWANFTETNKGTFVWPKTLRDTTVELPCPHGLDPRADNSTTVPPQFRGREGLTGRGAGQSTKGTPESMNGGPKGSTGIAVRRCGPKGQWEEPVTQRCQYSNLVTRRLLRMTLSDFGKVDRTKMLKDILDIIQNGTLLLEKMDLIYITHALEKLGDTFVEIISAIMDQPQATVINAHLQENVCSRLVSLLERVTDIMEFRVKHFAYTPNIIVESFVIKPTKFGGLVCSAFFHHQEDEKFVRRPNETRSANGGKGANIDLDELYNERAIDAGHPSNPYVMSGGKLSHSGGNSFLCLGTDGQFPFTPTTNLVHASIQISKGSITTNTPSQQNALTDDSKIFSNDLSFEEVDPVQRTLPRPKSAFSPYFNREGGDAVEGKKNKRSQSRQPPYGKEEYLNLRIIVYKNSKLFPINFQRKDHFNALYHKGILPDITSPVVNVKILNHPQTNFSHPVTIKLKCLGRTLYDQPISWNSRANYGYGDWVPNGCAVVGYENNMCILTCHFTNNIALVQDFNLQFYRNTNGVIASQHQTTLVKSYKRRHPQLLPWYMYIGGCILIICLVTLAVSYVTFQCGISISKTFRHTLVNYWFGLAFLVFVYLFSVKLIAYPIACQLAGISLHYATLSVLFWLTLVSKAIHIGSSYQCYEDNGHTACSKCFRGSKTLTLQRNSTPSQYCQNCIRLQRGHRPADHVPLILSSSYRSSSTLKTTTKNSPTGDTGKGYFGSGAITLPTHHGTNGCSLTANNYNKGGTLQNNLGHFMGHNCLESRKESVFGCYLIGWGISIIICGITAAISLNNYYALDNGYCFLVWEISLWALYFPATILLLINLLFLFKASYYCIKMTIARNNPLENKLKCQENYMPLDVTEKSSLYLHDVCSCYHQKVGVPVRVNSRAQNCGFNRCDHTHSNNCDTLKSDTHNYTNQNESKHVKKLSPKDSNMPINFIKYYNFNSNNNNNYSSEISDSDSCDISKSSGPKCRDCSKYQGNSHNKLDCHPANLKKTRCVKKHKIFHPNNKLNMRESYLNRVQEDRICNGEQTTDIDIAYFNQPSHGNSRGIVSKNKVVSKSFNRTTVPKKIIHSRSFSRPRGIVETTSIHKQLDERVPAPKPLYKFHSGQNGTRMGGGNDRNSHPERYDLGKCCCCNSEPTRSYHNQNTTVEDTELPGSTTCYESRLCTECQSFISSSLVPPSSGHAVVKGGVMRQEEVADHHRPTDLPLGLFRGKKFVRKGEVNLVGNAAVRMNYVGQGDPLLPILRSDQMTLRSFGISTSDSPSYCKTMLNRSDHKPKLTGSPTIGCHIDGEKGMSSTIKFQLLTILVCLVLWQTAGLVVYQKTTPFSHVLYLSSEGDGALGYELTRDFVTFLLSQKVLPRNISIDASTYDNYYGQRLITAMNEEYVTRAKNLQPAILGYYYHYYHKYVVVPRTTNENDMTNGGGPTRLAPDQNLGGSGPTYTTSSPSQTLTRTQTLASYAWTSVSIGIGLLFLIYHGLSRHDLVVSVRKIFAVIKSEEVVTSDPGAIKLPVFKDLGERVSFGGNVVDHGIEFESSNTGESRDLKEPDCQESLGHTCKSRGYDLWKNQLGPIPGRKQSNSASLTVHGSSPRHRKNDRAPAEWEGRGGEKNMVPLPFPNMSSMDDDEPCSLLTNSKMGETHTNDSNRTYPVQNKSCSHKRVHSNLWPSWISDKPAST